MATAPIFSSCARRRHGRRVGRQVFDVAVLAAFIFVRALLTILLDACSSGPDGYPFVFQTLLLFPFLLQIIFYALQTCASRGFVRGAQELLDARYQMLPAVFYSLMVAVSMFLQTLSQGFLDASTFVVLMQLTLVFVALGERYILVKPSTWRIWALICLQVVFVSAYQLSARAPTHAESAPGAELSEDAQEQKSGANGGHFVAGVVLCLLANVSSAVGNILQQRFMQSKSSAMPTSIKLCYQHFIGLLLMVTMTVTQPSAMSTIWANGFFHGWDARVAATSFCMWLSFLVASTVTAYISAMAGAMGSAVVVVVVGAFDVMVKGKDMAPLQGFSVLAIALVTATYTYVKDKDSKALAMKRDAGESKYEDEVEGYDNPPYAMRSQHYLRWRNKDAAQPAIATR